MGIELKEDDIESEDTEDSEDSEDNILDQDKLMGTLDEGNIGSDGSDEVLDEDEDDDIADEEFLRLWKHPLDGYANGVGKSKQKKWEKKARVLRRIEKRKAKHNRSLRRDAGNFEHGSNAVII